MRITNHLLLDKRFKLTDVEKDFATALADGIPVSFVAKQFKIKLELAEQLAVHPQIIQYKKTVQRQEFIHAKLDYYTKLAHLNTIIEKSLEENDDGQIDGNVAIKAIAEANKMQGHIAPVSTVNLSVENDKDLDKVKKLAEKFNRGY